MTRAAAIPTRADARTTTTAVRIVPLHGLAPEQRALLRAGQREAGVVYTVCMQAHKIACHTRGSWPSSVDLHRLTKGRHPDLCAQSVQATCKADGTIKSAVANRKAGNTRMRYPWKERYFQPIRWPAQALQRKRDGTRFPLGGIGLWARVRRPWGDPCRRARDRYGDRAHRVGARYSDRQTGAQPGHRRPAKEAGALYQALAPVDEVSARTRSHQRQE